jgi:3-oxoacyl-[acyl-carrier-protein] synthase II
VAAFARLGAMSLRNDDPESACRPFDADRDGFVMGEGAAFLILENWASAKARNAPVLGELVGYGTNCDAHHVVAPSPDGAVAAACIRRALADAELSPADIGHINAHGTATRRNDDAEARAVVSCFGENGPPVTASKSVLGHSLGASGAVEAAISLTSAASGRIPPVANFGSGQGVTKLLDVVAGSERVIARLPVLTSSFAFGGHNVSLVFRPC